MNARTRWIDVSVECVCVVAVAMCNQRVVSFFAAQDSLHSNLSLLDSIKFWDDWVSHQTLIKTINSFLRKIKCYDFYNILDTKKPESLMGNSGFLRMLYSRIDSLTHSLLKNTLHRKLCRACYVMHFNNRMS